jgi:hypothetical protein
MFHYMLFTPQGLWMDKWMSRALGNHQNYILGCSNFDCPLLGFGISYAYWCIQSCYKTMLAENINDKYDQLINYALKLLNNIEQNYITIKR